MSSEGGLNSAYESLAGNFTQELLGAPQGSSSDGHPHLWRPHSVWPVQEARTSKAVGKGLRQVHTKNLTLNPKLNFI